MAARKYKSNDIVGPFTLIERLPRDEFYNCSWMVKCNLCGRETKIYSTNLTKAKSCGCTYRKGVGDIPGSYWSSVLRSAKKRNIQVEITLEQAWDVYIQQNGKCALTDQPLTFVSEQKNRCFGTASLDRKDSLKPYTIDNVWWVHKDINLMKMDLTAYEFIKWCTKVAKKWDLTGIK